MKQKTIIQQTALLLSLVFLLPIFSMANSEPLTGKDLAQKIFDRDRGKTSRARATMVLVSKSGHKRTRNFTTLRKMENSLETQLIRFTSPADIQGTAFLTIEKEGWETTQFLYLPALRRTRRIVSSQKSHRFVNSDFTYEDMERHPVDDYTYKITGSKKIGSLDCYALETRPKQETSSQYAMTRSLVAKNSLVPVYAEYFDHRNRLIKTYKAVKIEKIDDIWTETTIMMEDVQREHKTYIKLQHIEYNQDIDSAQLSKQALEK